MTLVIKVHYYMILLKGYVYWLGLNNTLDINKYPRIIETTYRLLPAEVLICPLQLCFCLTHPCRLGWPVVEWASLIWAFMFNVASGASGEPTD